jgi:cell division protein FtsL
MTPVASNSAARTLQGGGYALPRAPRRSSGPTRRTAPRLIDRAAGVADARLLDRLIRGRAWIALVGVMLMGLVFVQVSMLQLNTGIARDVAGASQLERDNQQLRNTVATLGAGDRIETYAQRLGMVMPAAGQVRYLNASRASAQAAAAGISAPAPVAQQPLADGTIPTAADTPAATTTPTTVDQTGVAPPAGTSDPTASAATTQQQAAPPVQPAAAATQQTAAPPTTQSQPPPVQPTTGGAVAGP